MAKNLNGWERCPPGDLARLLKKLRHRRQRRIFLQTAAATLVVATGGASLWFALGPSGDPRPGGLACEEVEKLTPAYAKGQLDPATREKVRRHVAVCPRCGPMFKAMGLPT